MRTKAKDFKPTKDEMKAVIETAFLGFHEFREQINQGNGFHPDRQLLVRTYFGLEQLARRFGIKPPRTERAASAPEPKKRPAPAPPPEPEPDDPASVVLADNAPDDGKDDIRKYSRKKRTKKD